MEDFILFFVGHDTKNHNTIDESENHKKIIGYSRNSQKISFAITLTLSTTSFFDNNIFTSQQST
jgi:hypothetical protein